MFIVIARDATENDLLSNMSEELRDTDIKQSPNNILLCVCVTKYVRYYCKKLPWTELCHPNSVSPNPH